MIQPRIIDVMEDGTLFDVGGGFGSGTYHTNGNPIEPTDGGGAVGLEIPNITPVGGSTVVPLGTGGIKPPKDTPIILGNGGAASDLITNAKNFALEHPYLVLAVVGVAGYLIFVKK